MSSNDVQARVAGAWSWRTVHRAAKRIGVQVEKEKGQLTGGWHWILPKPALPEAATREHGTFEAATFEAVTIEGSTPDRVALELVAAEAAAEPVTDATTPQSVPHTDLPWLGTEPPPSYTARGREAPTGATERPYRLTKAQGDAAHANPWDNATIALFRGRSIRFQQRGHSTTNADALAERLHLRDVEGDDRRMCLECRHLERYGRCDLAREGKLPGADRHLEPIATILMRCEGFAP